MKKLFLGVMVFALIITSCNKYANDFQQLKDQIAALSLKVDGVAALQTQLTATTAQITALQAAVAGLPQAASISALTTGLATANTNIAAIQTQLNNLATTGATAASVAALKAQLDAAAAAKLVTDAATAKSLADLQTALAGAATSAELAAARTAILDLITSTATTSDAATAAAIAAAKADILTAIQAGSADVDAKIAALQAIVVAANTANAADLATLIANLEALATTVADNQTQTQESIAALNWLATQANTSLQILLAQSAMYSGNVIIETDQDVAFFLAKLNQLQIIDGNVLVNTGGITAGQKMTDLNTILHSMIAVIGQNDVISVTTTSHDHHGTTVTITAAAGEGHWVTILDNTGDLLTPDQLISIRGNYTVDGVDVADTKINNVGGTVLYNYPGAYESTSLKTVGMDLKLVDQVGTTDINFPNVVVGGHVGSTTGAATTAVTFVQNGAALTSYMINFGLATGGQINTLVANNASSITLGTTTPLSYTITAAKALTIDLSAATTTAGPAVAGNAINILTNAATAVNLSKLTTSVGNILVTNTATLTPWFSNGSVDLSAYNDAHHVTINGPQTIDKLGSWYGAAGSQLLASQALTVTLPHYQWLAGTEASLPAVKWLTLGGAADLVTISNYPTLVTADITGTVKQIGTPDPTHWTSVTAGVASAGNANLTSLTVSGLVNTVDVTALPMLSAVTTSGIISTFRLDNAGANVLVTETVLTLNHVNFVGAIGYGGPGSQMIVTNNSKVKTLTTHTDKMLVLTVTGNSALATADFGSYVTLINNVGAPTVAINVTNNNFTGSFTPALAALPETPYREAQIVSADLATLKAYVNALDASTLAYTLSLDVKNSTLLGWPLLARAPVGAQVVNSVYTLVNSMWLNAQVSAVIDDTAGINTVGEMNLIQ
jgi:hypothetical protein